MNQILLFCLCCMLVLVKAQISCDSMWKTSTIEIHQWNQHKVKTLICPSDPESTLQISYKQSFGADGMSILAIAHGGKNSCELSTNNTKNESTSATPHYECWRSPNGTVSFKFGRTGPEALYSCVNNYEYGCRLFMVKDPDVAITTTPIPTTTPTTTPTPTTSLTPPPTTPPASSPSTSPNPVPATAPTFAPTLVPTFAPTNAPTTAPTNASTTSPTIAPSPPPNTPPTLPPTEQPNPPPKSTTDVDDEQETVPSTYRTATIAFAAFAGTAFIVACIKALLYIWKNGLPTRWQEFINQCMSWFPGCRPKLVIKIDLKNEDTQKKENKEKNKKIVEHLEDSIEMVQEILTLDS